MSKEQRTLEEKIESQKNELKSMQGTLEKAIIEKNKVQKAFQSINDYFNGMIK